MAEQMKESGIQWIGLLDAFVHGQPFVAGLVFRMFYIVLHNF